MVEAVGRRERKKQEMRELIAATARRLFAERGFDQVSVAEIAREADVAEKTVFNHFATKEDLFYEGLEPFEDQLLEALRTRPAGQTVAGAFRSFLLEPPRGQTAGGSPPGQLREIATAIAGSPALLAREQRMFAQYAKDVAELIREELGAPPRDVRPWVAANALVGVHRALVDLVRRRTLAGHDEPRHLARDVRAEATQAFDLLETGLRRYGVKPRPSTRR